MYVGSSIHRFKLWLWQINAPRSAAISSVFSIFIFLSFFFFFSSFFLFFYCHHHHQESKARRKPRWDAESDIDATLEGLALWLLCQCGRFERDVRKACMQLFTSIVPLLPGPRAGT